ncbi:MAG: hypothetical protein FJX57_24780, partial [Alphaproteobacteria bacterium]|nr:hypothetical protein [Alphaproteobacteria bacterium]
MTTETDDILASFDRHPSRRRMLQGLVALGASGIVLSRFADALAQASGEDIASLTILSQAGIVPEILNTSALTQFRKINGKTEIKLEIGANAVAYPKMLSQRSNPVISGGMFNDIFAQRGIADGMWAKFDPALVPNAANVPKEMATP